MAASASLRAAPLLPTVCRLNRQFCVSRKRPDVLQSPLSTLERRERSEAPRPSERLSEHASPPSLACQPKLSRTLASVSEGWSGRRGSNPRPTAWKAVTLPLSYSRLLPPTQGLRPPAPIHALSLAASPARSDRVAHSLSSFASRNRLRPKERRSRSRDPIPPPTPAVDLRRRERSEAPRLSGSAAPGRASDAVGGVRGGRAPLG